MSKFCFNVSYCTYCFLVGLQEAAQMIMTGKTLKADKAKKAGLVDLVVDPACLEVVAIQQVMKMSASCSSNFDYLNLLMRSIFCFLSLLLC